MSLCALVVGMDNKTIFRSTRLNGRAATQNDAGLYAALFDHATAAARLAEDLADWERDQLAPWVLFHAEHAVGIAGFRRAAGGEALELRFDFLPEAAGQGLASEFVQAALDHATLVPGQDRFFAIVGDDNPASIRVLEKAGFHAAPDGQRMQLDLRPRAGARRSDPTA